MYINDKNSDLVRETILEVNGALENMKICLYDLSTKTEVMLLRGFSTLNDAECIWDILSRLEKDVYFYIFKYYDFGTSYKPTLKTLSDNKRQLLAEKISKLSMDHMKEIDNELTKVLIALFGTPKLLNGKKHDWTSSENKKRIKKSLEFSEFILDKISVHMKSQLKNISDDCDTINSPKFSKEEVIENANLYTDLIEKRDRLFFDIVSFPGMGKTANFVQEILEKIMELFNESNVVASEELFKKFDIFNTLILTYGSSSEKVWDQLEDLLWLNDIHK